MPTIGFSRPALILFLLPSLLCAGDLETATERVRAHTVFLADDLLEGRAAGTRGYDLAARYVASQFARIGLEPGADHDSYLQPMRFIESTNKIEAGRFTVRHSGGEDALVPINDMIAYPNISETAATVTAPAVFVGFGVQAPELGHDDFAGVDLTGKIAVMLWGAPKQFPSTQRAHHSNREQKRVLAAKHGAVGLVIIQTPALETIYPWALMVANNRFPAMALLDANGAVVDGHPQLKAGAAVSRAAAGRLFAASGHTVADVFARAEKGEAMSFDLKAEITIGGEATLRPVESANVLGWLPGTDPALAKQPVVVTGHLDHLGIAAPVNGDAIYNGAMDNAVGIGLILAAAEEFPAPVRSLIAWGAEHTTLGALTESAATKAGWVVTPDPMPEETIFARSDQYPFVQSGVPSIYLSSGMKPVDPAVDLPGMWTEHLKVRYHKPSDDLSQPMDWPSAGALAGLITDILRDAANATPAPAWLPGDFFGGLYGRKK